MRSTSTWALAAFALGAFACVPPGKAAADATAAGQTGGLVRPNGSPAPSSPDATMPASLPPPPAPTTLAQRNRLYTLGQGFAGGGIGLMVAGGVFVTLGAVLPCKGTGCKTAKEAETDKTMGDVFVGLGAGGLIAGGVFLAIGIPLWVAGHGQISRQLERGSEEGLYLAPDGFGVRF